MNGKYEIGEIVMKNWAIRRKLGEGSFSRVYEIERKDFGETYYAALKVITIPQGEAELQAALEEMGRRLFLWLRGGSVFSGNRDVPSSEQEPDAFPATRSTSTVLQQQGTGPGPAYGRGSPASALLRGGPSGRDRLKSGRLRPRREVPGSGTDAPGTGGDPGLGK